MTISKRLTRAGLAFTVFGLCASMLPNSATAITGADACGSTGGGGGTSSNNNGGTSGFVTDQDVAVGVVGAAVIGYELSTLHHKSSGTASNLPSSVEQKPATQPVSETTQRQQLQQLKGFAYNGQ